MNAFLVTGNNRKSVNDGLGEVLRIVFDPASAKASVSGENRGLAAKALASAIPQLGKFDAIVIESEEGVITVKNDNLVSVLGKVTEAYNKMESVREELESHEQAYRLVRSFVPSNPSNGKRGRKASDPASKYASLLTA